MNADLEKMEQRIQAALVEKEGKWRLSCGDAHEIAEEVGCALKDIGEYCDEKKIKIFHCELGCF